MSTEQATIAEYCGVPLPDRLLDGKSIVAMIESAEAKSPHEVLHWETGKHWAIREGDWKLVHNGPATDQNGRKIPQVADFLSHLGEDVTETKNLADQHPEIVARLTNRHQQWAKEVQRQ
ncbi:MAG: hypothetical protein FJ280_29695 [Planctomycetes bacterium]|nr:hypothetical protein [Planctomycetota bacterium]